MSKFGSLLKVQFREILNINKNNKKEVKKAIGLGSALLAIFLLCLFISATYNFLIFDTYRQLGDTTTYLPLVYVLSSMVILVTGLIKVKATLFGNKDYNLLEAMPLKHSTIIAAKIFVIYLYELIFAVTFMSPAIVIMAIKEFDLTTTIMSVVGMLTLPVVPILIGGIIGLPMAFIFDKTKYGSIISLVLYVVYIVALMYFVYGKSTPEAKGVMYSKMVVNINKGYIISKLFTNSLSGNTIQSVLFILSQIGFVIVFIALASLTYKPINDNIMSKNLKVEYKSKALKNSGASKALIKKEFKKIFSSTNITLNALLGGIMSILMLVIMYVSFKQPMGDSFEEYKDILFPFMLIVICFGLGMSPVSGYNISLEGESFWILKTAPIEPKAIIKAKLLVGALVLVPFSIAASIVLIVLFTPSIVGMVAAVVIPLLYIALVTYLGMIIQLRHPHLHFKNELEVLKRGAAPILNMFIGMGIDALIAAVLVGLGIFVHMYLAYAVIAGIIIIGVFLARLYLVKRGDSIFEEIA